jgi:hypothetical protein
MNDADLEDRLIQARPSIPEPPPLVRDRARRAALATVPSRRLRRGWLLAVAAAVVLGALIVPPALGVGGSLLDLLPLGGEKEEEQFRGACKATTIQVTFDPAKGAAVTSGGETPAFAGFRRHEVAAACTPLPAPRNASPHPDAAFQRLPEDGVYESTRLVCEVPGTVDVNAHPIFFENVGNITGSGLLIAVSDPLQVIVSAALPQPEPGPLASTTCRTSAARARTAAGRTPILSRIAGGQRGRPRATTAGRRVLSVLVDH